MGLAPLLAALALFAGFSAQAGSNVALLGTASQSSSWSGDGNPLARASNAIDGNTDGNYYGGSVQHTNSDSGLPVGNGFAWWQVALDQNYLIDSITIGGSSPSMLNIEKGAALATPLAPSVVTRAIGRGTIRLAISL